MPASSSVQSGLSTGAKAGIAVGVIGVVLIALIALFLLWRRKRGNAQSKNALSEEPDLPPSYLAPELPAEEATHPTYKKEVSTTANDLELMGDTKLMAEKAVQGKEPATQVETSPMVAELQSPASDRNQISMQPSSQVYPPDSHELKPAIEKLTHTEELATPANTHELSPTVTSPEMQTTELATRANDHELDTSSAPAEQQSLARNESRVQQILGQSNLPPAVAELPPKQTFSQPFSTPTDPYIVSPLEGEGTNMPHEQASSTSSPNMPSGQNTSAGGSSRMDELHAKRDKIRLEKERLLKLQELDDLEASVQKEILEEARRERGEEG